MPDSNAVAGLKKQRAIDSANKKRAVFEALARMRDAGTPVTISAVAAEAKVSRPFVYSHEALVYAIKGAQSVATAQAQPLATTPATGGAQGVAQGLRADKATLVAKVERQRAQITELKQQVEDLEHQRRRWLGQQLPGFEPADPEVVAELRIANDRLATNNAALTRSLEESRNLRIRLENELAASRQAHSEDLAIVGTADRVVAFRPSPYIAP
jgi:hypothetical protein